MGAPQQVLAGVAGAVPHVYATWNPSDKGVNVTLSNGNLTYSTLGFSQSARSTVSESAGKWYYEYTNTGSFGSIGVDNGSANANAAAGAGAQSIVYQQGGAVVKGGSIIATYASWTNGDTIAVAFDCATGNVTFYKNNVLQGTPGSITGSIFALGGDQVAASVVGTANFGATALTYSPPSGYNAGLY